MPIWCFGWRAADRSLPAATLLVTFRGTCNLRNAKTDLQVARVVPGVTAGIPPDFGPGSKPRCLNKTGGGGVRIHSGFYEAYMELRKELLATVDEFAQQIKRETKRDKIRLLVTGHSLGGALAVLAATDFSLLDRSSRPRPYSGWVGCASFGAPKAGNARFAGLVEASLDDAIRVVQDGDAVCATPPDWWAYR